MKRLMVLGACPSQLPTIMKAKEMGIEVIAVDKDPDAEGFKYADLCIQTSVKNTDFLVRKARELNIDGVIAPCGDSGTETAGAIVDALHLHGISRLATHTMNDKRLTYQILQNEGILTPKRDCPIDAEYPLIVKPYDGVASRGVYKIESKDDVHVNMENNIMEEFIEGDLISISLVMQDGIDLHLIVVDQVLSQNNFGTRMFMYPSKFYSESLMLLIIKNALRVARAFSVTDGVIEIEAIVKDNKVYFIDVNPRMAGGHLFDAFTLSSSIDWIATAINVSLGISLPLEISHYKPFIVALAGSEVSGTLTSILVHKEIFDKYNIKLLVFWKGCGEQIGSVLTKETSSDQTIYVIYTNGEDLAECLHNLSNAVDRIELSVMEGTVE